MDEVGPGRVDDCEQTGAIGRRDGKNVGRGEGTEIWSGIESRPRGEERAAISATICGSETAEYAERYWYHRHPAVARAQRMGQQKGEHVRTRGAPPQQLDLTMIGV
jgi:hypothetical protein